MKNLFYLLCLALSSTGMAQEKGDNEFLYRGIPQLHTPSVIGNYPSSPFLYYVPVSGERPVSRSVEGLPVGLAFDAETGIISGVV
ncbi:MAG: alpha-galactosidase, partial [Prevotella sp.]|nr:alpha-galactosidase [Prevotella sp.]